VRPVLLQLTLYQLIPIGSNRGGGGRGRGRGRGRGGGGDGSYYGHQHFVPTLSDADREYYCHMAHQQIEYIFSGDNLCLDTYVRAYMDEEGYVPIALVCNYPNVAHYGLEYTDIVAKLAKTCEASTSMLEVDVENETVRVRSGWEMVRVNLFTSCPRKLFVCGSLTLLLLPFAFRSG
jgi:La domain